MGGPTSWLFQALFVAPILSRIVGKRLGLLLWWKPFDRDDLRTLERLLADGSLKPVIDRRYPLTEIVAASATSTTAMPAARLSSPRDGLP